MLILLYIYLLINNSTKPIIKRIILILKNLINIKLTIVDKLIKVTDRFINILMMKVKDTNKIDDNIVIIPVILNAFLLSLIIINNSNVITVIKRYIKYNIK